MPEYRNAVPLVLAAGLMLTSAAAPRRSDPPCPLQIRQIWLSGRAPQVVVRNPTGHPVSQIVLHAAFEDLLNEYHERTQRFDVVIQPGQRQTLSMDPIKGTSVEWGTLEVSAACEVTAGAP